jgi:hypothetical protein
MANAVTHRATILPQPAEATWTAVKFVDLLFRKAGLDSGSHDISAPAPLRLSSAGIFRVRLAGPFCRPARKGEAFFTLCYTILAKKSKTRYLPPKAGRKPR